jgi:predicted amidohydrolase
MPFPAHTTLPLEYGRLGIGICYDIRFAELAQSYARQVRHLMPWIAQYLVDIALHLKYTA